MAKYRKKPVVIEAIQWTGDNLNEIIKFMKFSNRTRTVYRDKIIIYTLEGAMTASIGDYIIKGVSGEFYPCKPDIFEKTYEKVE